MDVPPIATETVFARITSVFAIHHLRVLRAPSVSAQIIATTMEFATTQSVFVIPDMLDSIALNWCAPTAALVMETVLILFASVIRRIQKRTVR